MTPKPSKRSRGPFLAADYPVAQTEYDEEGDHWSEEELCTAARFSRSHDQGRVGKVGIDAEGGVVDVSAWNPALAFRQRRYVLLIAVYSIPHNKKSCLTR